MSSNNSLENSTDLPSEVRALVTNLVTATLSLIQSAHQEQSIRRKIDLKSLKRLVSEGVYNKHVYRDEKVVAGRDVSEWNQFQKSKKGQNLSSAQLSELYEGLNASEKADLTAQTETIKAEQAKERGMEEAPVVQQRDLAKQMQNVARKMKAQLGVHCACICAADSKSDMIAPFSITNTTLAKKFVNDFKLPSHLQNRVKEKSTFKDIIPVIAEAKVVKKNIKNDKYSKEHNDKRKSIQRIVLQVLGLPADKKIPWKQLNSPEGYNNKRLQGWPKGKDLTNLTTREYKMVEENFARKILNLVPIDQDEPINNSEPININEQQ